MSAKLVSVDWQDDQGRRGTFSFWVKGATDPAGAPLRAVLQSLKDMSGAKIMGAQVGTPIDLSALTGNAVDPTGPYNAVRDQAILQCERADGTGYISLTVPAPAVAIFEASGEYEGAQVDTAQTDVTDFVAAAFPGIICSPQEGNLSLRKGWRKGQPHK